MVQCFDLVVLVYWVNLSNHIHSFFLHKKNCFFSHCQNILSVKFLYKCFSGIFIMYKNSCCLSFGSLIGIKNPVYCL